MLRALATVLALSVATQATAQAVVFHAPVPAPEKSAPVEWVHNGGEAASGRWYSQAQIEAVAAEIVKARAERNAAVDAAAAAKVERDVAQGKAKIPSWVWIITASVTGVAGGYFGTKAVQ